MKLARGGHPSHPPPPPLGHPLAWKRESKADFRKGERNPPRAAATLSRLPKRRDVALRLHLVSIMVKTVRGRGTGGSHCATRWVLAIVSLKTNQPSNQPTYRPICAMATLYRRDFSPTIARATTTFVSIIAILHSLCIFLSLWYFLISPPLIRTSLRTRIFSSDVSPIHDSCERNGEASVTFLCVLIDISAQYRECITNSRGLWLNVRPRGSGVVAVAQHCKRCHNVAWKPIDPSDIDFCAVA